MSKNYDDYGYEYDNNGSNITKKILIIGLIVVSILIIIFLIRGCSTGGDDTNKVFDYESAMLVAGKAYYENNKDEYPGQIGECSEVNLQTLIDKGLIDTKNFNSCNKTSTYLRVCMLPNGNKQYTPWITCEDKKSEELYDNLKEGSLNDIIINESYVDFKFLPQIIKVGEENLGDEVELWKDEISYDSYKTLASTNYYRFRDKLYKWNVTTKTYYTSKGDNTDVNSVKEYYTVAPNSNYKLYDSKTTEAYKWYTTTQEKVYALNSEGRKAPSPTPIGDYIHKEGGVIVPLYRTRTATLTSETPNLFYICAVKNSTDERYVKYQPSKCGQGSDPDYKYQIGTVYSCASTTSSNETVVGQIVDSANSKCYEYGSWSGYTQTPCNTSLKTCMKDDVTFYYWYKYEGTGDITYYPSGSSSASAEKVYYISAPIEGAIKDTSTKATAYKWYKSSTKTTLEYTAVPPSGYASASKTDDYKWSSWSEWSIKNPKVSDGRTRSIETKTKIKLRPILSVSDDSWVNLANNNEYLKLDEMINLLKTNGYKINTLDDISNDGSVRYQVKMYVRNKKENK